MPSLVSLTRALEYDLCKMKGVSDKDILLKYWGWHELTIPEMWERLLRTNKFVQRMFPKQAFLIALDDVKLNKYQG